MFWKFKCGKALAAVAAIMLAGLTGLVAGAGPSRADAVSLKRKVTSIADFSARPTTKPLRTTVTENEVNAYLAFDASDQLPSGVVEPTIAIVGTGRVTARAIVDLDTVRKQRTRTMMDPMNLATGRVPITATGLLTTGSGVGRLQFESASLGPVPIPKVLLQEIVGYYSRTPENPAGISLDDAFALPARIREIQVEPGRAIVVQ
ncbi:MAG: hypothetical protein ABI868_13800 [Acidobacteriota bacterium]